LTPVQFTTTGEVGGLLPHLLHLTPGHREEGMALQADLVQFEIELKTAVEETWHKSSEPDDDRDAKDWTIRMKEKEKEEKMNPIKRVEKPGLSEAYWQIELYHLNRK
jgi:elongator complex protein 1